jgi:ATP-binding protein involved in chromosome partitioning
MPAPKPLAARAMVDEQALRERLPAKALERLQALRLTNGAATLVMDASGLDNAERSSLEQAVRDTLEGAEGVSEVRVAMTATKPERKLIAIGSGKGGVGKSTLTANLAVALARMGRKVGIVDADIHGPSQPKLLGTEGLQPRAEGNKLIPVPSEFGVPSLSLGYLVEPGKAVAWRGPMAGNALTQLVDAEWGDVELLLLDLPPGTGDVQLTMLQKFKPAGAVVVSTPQDLALIDARRALDLFRQGGVPVLGLVENMAGYACPHCGEISDPFGMGGVERAAEELGLPFLGRVPLTLAVREASDAGRPPAAGGDEVAEPFLAIAAQLAERVG